MQCAIQVWQAQIGRFGTGYRATAQAVWSDRKHIHSGFFNERQVHCIGQCNDGALSCAVLWRCVVAQIVSNAVIFSVYEYAKRALNVVM